VSAPVTTRNVSTRTSQHQVARASSAKRVSPSNPLYTCRRNYSKHSEPVQEAISKYTRALQSQGENVEFIQSAFYIYIYIVLVTSFYAKWKISLERLMRR